MKKEKKVLLILILIVFTIVIGFFATHYFIKIHLTNAALSYLCEKYDATETEFELVDYERSKYFLNDDAIPQLEKGCYKWEFRYQGRNFYVNKTDEKYCDDYQLEDVEKWCVEWLQDNIDKSIYFVDISSNDLYLYQQSIDNPSFCFSQNTIIDFFHYFDEQKTYDTCLWVSYDNENINSKILEERINQIYALFGVVFKQEQRTVRKMQIDKNEMCWRHWYWFEENDLEDY